MFEKNLETFSNYCTNASKSQNYNTHSGHNIEHHGLPKQSHALTMPQTFHNCRVESKLGFLTEKKRK